MLLDILIRANRMSTPTASSSRFYTESIKKYWRQPRSEYVVSEVERCRANLVLESPWTFRRGGLFTRVGVNRLVGECYIVVYSCLRRSFDDAKGELQAYRLKPVVVPSQWVNHCILIPKLHGLVDENTGKKNVAHCQPLAHNRQLPGHELIQRSEGVILVMNHHVINRANYCQSWVPKNSHLEPVVGNNTLGLFHASPQIFVGVCERTIGERAGRFAGGSVLFTAANLQTRAVTEGATIVHRKLVLEFRRSDDRHTVARIKSVKTPERTVSASDTIGKQGTKPYRATGEGV